MYSEQLRKRDLDQQWVGDGVSSPHRTTVADSYQCLDNVWLIYDRPTRA